MAQLKWRYIFLVGLVGYINVVLSKEKERLVTRECLGCMCEAISGCDVNYKCGTGSKGLFCITKNYWIDGDMPVIWRDNSHDDNAYDRCVVDPFCAARAIEGYARRYDQDCNNDGERDCKDYMKMHFQGLSCVGTYPELSMQKFNNCWDGVLRDLEKLKTT